MQFSTVLFDLGGVLVDLPGLPIRAEWVGDGRDPEDLWRGWLNDPVVHAFERGEIGAEDFAEHFVLQHQLQVATETFLAYFAQWPQPLTIETRQLIETLKKQCRVGVLSNISVVHWQRLMFETGDQGLFDHRFFSFQLGMTKPSSSIFKHVIKSLGVAPAEVLFLDDNDKNIEVARELGLSAEGVAGVDGVVCCLKRLGLL